ncbi:translation initiation factor IF-3 [Sinomonas terrae]|uniref:Translation initiation factor IF-3 n=1 Tax=Sinomonas terrae TaxID=2908838 RepID=A0ABS9U2F1_9MICC|nr:translation initiation factor IF-3 [Sinomonas terrae]MCH6470872.1 translation initiation factor IF-3 [Sinomonas terrae]
MNISDPRINERIRVPEVRLVGPAGEQVGIVRIEDALRLAAESDLDLVEVAPQAKPPVCKLMDFGKYKYEAAVKAREARKNQTNTVLKEIRFRLKIDTHDYETKKGHALRFLGAGDKVKAMIQFRGREQQRPEMGIRLLQRFADDVAEVGTIESAPRIDGRNMVMVIGPLKNKAEAKAEARRVAQRAADKAKAEAAKTASVTAEQAPMTQSLGDALPEALRQAAVQADEQPAAAVESEEPTSQAAESAPAAETAQIAESAPAAETAQAAEPAPAAEEPAQAAELAPAAEEPAQAAERPAAAKPAAAKPAAEPERKPAPARAAAPAPSASPRPAPAPRPQAPKPAEAAKPAAPKPSAPRPQAPKPGAPRPGAGAPKPSAPRPSGRRGN